MFVLWEENVQVCIKSHGSMLSRQRLIEIILGLNVPVVVVSIQFLNRYNKEL